MTCFPGGHRVLSSMDGMKKEHRFWESWRERSQSLEDARWKTGAMIWMRKIAACP